jgi:hypothetical protein
LDFYSILQWLKESSFDIIFLFDQFEQYLLARARDLKEDNFARNLVKWYAEKEDFNHKVIFSMRGDFLDKLTPLRHLMQFTLGPQEEINLQKFTPRQAKNILKVISGTEGFDYDEQFIESICQNELIDKNDGLISPVDIQILAMMVVSLSYNQNRAFDKKTFENLGGVEGLLFRYLEKALTNINTEGKKDDYIKVLLSLINKEDNVKAGMQTIAELESNLAGQLKPNQIQAALVYLSRPDVRLVNAGKKGNEAGYELAHERIIPALRKLANTALTNGWEIKNLPNIYWEDGNITG